MLIWEQGVKKFKSQLVGCWLLQKIYSIFNFCCWRRHRSCLIDCAMKLVAAMPNRPTVNPSMHIYTAMESMEQQKASKILNQRWNVCTNISRNPFYFIIFSVCTLKLLQAVLTIFSNYPKWNVWERSKTDRSETDCQPGMRPCETKLITMWDFTVSLYWKRRWFSDET